MNSAKGHNGERLGLSVIWGGAERAGIAYSEEEKARGGDLINVYKYPSRGGGGSKGDIFHTVCMVEWGNGLPRKAVGSAPLKMLKILLDKVLSNVLSLTLL